MSSNDQDKIALAREYFIRADQGRRDVLDLFREDAEIYFPKFGFGFGLGFGFGVGVVVGVVVVVVVGTPAPPPPELTDPDVGPVGTPGPVGIGAVG